MMAILRPILVLSNFFRNIFPLWEIFECPMIRPHTFPETFITNICCDKFVSSRSKGVGMTKRQNFCIKRLQYWEILVKEILLTCLDTDEENNKNF